MSHACLFYSPANRDYWWTNLKYVKKLPLALTILLVSVTLFSCKKSSSAPKPHVFTSYQTVEETASTSATITKNSSGVWVVSGLSTETPVIDSLTMTGDVSFQVFDNSIYQFTRTTPVTVGQPFVYELNGIPLSNPTLQEVVYSPGTSTSTGSIFYTVNYH